LATLTLKDKNQATQIEQLVKESIALRSESDKMLEELRYQGESVLKKMIA